MEETRFEQNRTENLICIDRWRVWREMAEYGGVRRDMAEYGGIWREVKTPSKHLILSYYCIKEQFRNMWRDDGGRWRGMAEYGGLRHFSPFSAIGRYKSQFPYFAKSCFFLKRVDAQQSWILLLGLDQWRWISCLLLLIIQ